MTQAVCWNCISQQTCRHLPHRLLTLQFSNHSILCHILLTGRHISFKKLKNIYKVLERQLAPRVALVPKGNGPYLTLVSSMRMAAGC